MSQINLEWQRNKAEQVLHDQAESISRSQFPDGVLAQGFIEAFYAIDILSDQGKGYWERSIDVAVQQRRTELREKKHSALFDSLGEIDASWIAGGLHGSL